MTNPRITLVFLLFAAVLRQAIAADPPPVVPAGVAGIDITPQQPVPLINIKEPIESNRVGQRLTARALAIGSGTNAVLLISFDGIGVPGSLAEEVAGRLEKDHGLSRERIAICASHTHWAPHLTDLLGNIYGGPLPEKLQAHADAYTRLLADRLEAVAREALEKRVPSHLSRSTGRVTFAANRRLEEGGQLIRDLEKGLMVTWNPEGPVDHDLPVFVVRDASTGALAALHFTYACHNVAITGTTDISGFGNAVHGDWLGLTLDEIERRHPGCVAIGTIGCGGDQRPDFCGDEAVAQAHANEISDEIDRLLAEERWRSFGAPEGVVLDRVELPLSPLPPMETLQDFADYRIPSPPMLARKAVAEKRLAEIEEGREAPSGVPFLSQAWHFSGDGPVLLFLTGEVCVDFQLRLKAAHGEALWPIAYANEVPCYIVSKRMLERGGYEAGNSMFYYGWLRTLLPEAENIVIESAERVIEPR